MVSIFHRAITDDGFLMIEEDHYVYAKWSKGSFVIFSPYVDDILLVRNDKELIIAIKE